MAFFIAQILSVERVPTRMLGRGLLPAAPISANADRSVRVTRQYDCFILERTLLASFSICSAFFIASIDIVPCELFCRY